MTTQKKNSHFSTDFLNKIKDILLKEKDRLETELNKFAKKDEHANGNYDTTFPEYGDKSDENALEITQYLTNKPLEMTLEHELQDVNKALKRLGEDSYGTCKYCHLPIDEKRLLARPTSGACVSCKKTLTNEI